MYEDEFELTFQVPEEESAPEPLAAPAAKPAAPVEPVVDEPTRIMTLGKTAAPAVDEPTRWKSPQSRLRWSCPKRLRRSL